jgi:hypothetical protein
VQGKTAGRKETTVLIKQSEDKEMGLRGKVEKKKQKMQHANDTRRQRNK